MSNGKIAEANVEALLVGVPPEELPRMRFILTTLSETKTGLEDLRDVCESRAAICPGLALADPVTVKEREQESHELWLLRSGSRTLLERIALPLALVLLTIGLTRLFG